MQRRKVDFPEPDGPIRQTTSPGSGRPSGCGVQDALERALNETAQRELKADAAGRTDAGVHATSQVVHADAPDDRPLTAWVRGVNAHLPSSAAVLWALAGPADKDDKAGSGRAGAGQGVSA